MSDSYFNTRSMHAYDALRCAHAPVCLCTCVWGVWGVRSMSEIVRCWFSRTQRTIPGLWNSPVCAFYFWTVSRSLLALLASAIDWPLCFSFVRVASCQLCSALVSALDSAKYVHCKCPAALSSIAKRRCPPELCPPSTLQWHPTLSVSHDKLTFQTWAQIDISKHDCKLTFLSVTATYVQTYLRHTHILRIIPSFRASC